jgi:hypothetical protein
MAFRGLIIQESLPEGVLRSVFDSYITHEYEYALEGENSPSVTICVVDVPESNLSEVMFLLADQLFPLRYYAHFVMTDRIAVVFPKCVYFVGKDDVDGAETCRKIGRMFDIPDEQMPFEALFYNDHPND